MSEHATGLQDTIAPKSDQLNADDLLTGPITVTVAGVRRGSAEQPVEILIEGQRPYRPCKSMRRVLIAAWGDDGHKWVGRSMTLYCDPSVKFGGVAVGGIRISHLSHIGQKSSFMLTTTRSRRSPFVVEPLEQAEPLGAYPPEKFKENLPAWRMAIKKGAMTADEIVARASGNGRLTEEQIAQIKNSKEK